MGRASNETNLIVALLKEKAKAQKEFSARLHKPDKERINYERGIDWTLNTLDQILQNEIVGK